MVWSGAFPLVIQILAEIVLLVVLGNKVPSQDVLGSLGLSSTRNLEACAICPTMSQHENPEVPLQPSLVNFLLQPFAAAAVSKHYYSPCSRKQRVFLCLICLIKLIKIVARKMY